MWVEEKKILGNEPTGHSLSLLFWFYFSRRQIKIGANIRLRQSPMILLQMISSPTIAEATT